MHYDKMVRIDVATEPRAWGQLVPMLAVSCVLSAVLIGSLHGLRDAYNIGQAVGCVLGPMLVALIAIAFRAKPTTAWAWFVGFTILMAVGSYNGRSPRPRDASAAREVQALASMAQSALKNPDKETPLAALPALTEDEAASLKQLKAPQSDAELLRFLRLTYQQHAGDASRELKVVEAELAKVPLDQVLMPKNLVSHDRLAWGRSQMAQAYELIVRRNSIVSEANRELDSKITSTIPTDTVFGRNFYAKYYEGKAKRDRLTRQIMDNQTALKGEFDALMTMMDDVVGQSHVEGDSIYFDDQQMADDYNGFLERINALAVQEEKLQKDAIDLMQTALNTLASASR